MSFKRIRDWMALERNVSAVVLESSITVFGNALWMPFLPIFFENTLKLSPVEIGAIYSTGALSLMLGALLAGHSSDLMGRKRILIFASFLLPITPILFTLAQNWVHAVLTYSFSSFANGLVSPPLGALIAESVQAHKRGTALATIFAVPSFPAVIAPSLGAQVIENISWEIVFYIGAILLVIGAVVIAAFTRETARIQKKNRIKKPSFLSKLGNMRRDRVFLTLVLANMFISFSSEALGPYVALYSENQIGMSIFSFGAMFSIVTLVVGIFSMLGGKLADRIGRKQAICISEGLESIFILGFVFSTNAFWAIFTYVTFVAVDYLDISAPRAWIADLSGDEERGWRMGFFAGFASMAGIPASFFGGWAYALEPRVPFFIQSVFSLTAALMILSLREKSARHTSLTGQVQSCHCELSHYQEIP